MVEKNRSKRYVACSDVVRVKGFEPPTYWFVASHSIQLSYTRILEGGRPSRQLCYHSTEILKLQEGFSIFYFLFWSDPYARDRAGRRSEAAP